MENEGFTLIELLAVIVILGVILTFAIMKVSEFIEKAEKQTLIKEADSILDVVRYEISTGKELLGEYNIVDGTFVEENSFSYSGSLPKSGKIKIVNNEELLIAISDGYWCVSKSYFDKDYQIYKNEGTCTPSLDITTDSEIAKCFSFINSATPTAYGGVEGLAISNYTCSNKKILIPNTYNDEPIVGIDKMNCTNCITKVDMSYTNNLKYVGESAFKSSGLEEVIFSPTIEAISNYAFENNKLTNITLPSSLKMIRTGAFSNNSLVNLELPDSVISLYNSAFYRNQLKTLKLSNSLTDIGSYAFADNSLISVTIPDSVNSIESYAFWRNDLKNAVLSNSLTKIDEYVFSENNLTSIVIPNSVTLIDEYAFYYNELENVVFPDSLIEIDDYAFDRNNLTSVIIPDSVTGIGYFAFRYNKLTSVKIPSSIEYISGSAFFKSEVSNPTLSTITYNGVNPFHWDYIINGGSYGTISFTTGIVTNPLGNVTISAN